MLILLFDPNDLLLMTFIAGFQSAPLENGAL